MKRIVITGLARLAAVPASLGLIGGASFAQSAPVRVPSQATVVGGQGTHFEIGDEGAQLATAKTDTEGDHGALRTSTGPGDDNGDNRTQVQASDGKATTNGSAKVDNGRQVSTRGVGG